MNASTNSISNPTPAQIIPFCGPSVAVPAYATSVLEIDLKRIGNNYLTLKALQGDGIIAPVLKADAYGMHMTAVAPTLYEKGARHFFVSHVEEGIALRKIFDDQQNRDSAIYILNGLFAGTAPFFMQYNLTPCLIHLAQLAEYAAYARDQGQTLPAVLYVDTGFTRTGMSPAEMMSVANDLSQVQGLAIKGVMSHLAFSKTPEHWKNAEQRRVFQQVTEALPPELSQGFRSLSNSGGMFLGNDYVFDLSRPGKALYGVGCTQKLNVKPAVKLWARFIQIQAVPAGYTVGYDGVFVTPRPSILGTVGMGHGDSWFKGLRNKGVAYVNGQRVPFVGLVSMDLTVVDLTDMLEGSLPKIGDWAEIIGPHLSMDEVARISVTSVHKILTSLGHRHHRVYT